MPWFLLQCLDCYLCVDNSPQRCLVFCRCSVSTLQQLQATCCRLQVRSQMILSLTPAETITGVSCEGGVTTAPGADRLTTDVRTLVSVGTGYTGYRAHHHRTPGTRRRHQHRWCLLWTTLGSNCERWFCLSRPRSSAGMFQVFVGIVI